MQWRTSPRRNRRGGRFPYRPIPPNGLQCSIENGGEVKEKSIRGGVIRLVGQVVRTLVRIGMMPFSAMASKKALLDFCSRSNEMAARLAEQGIALYYHNHHIEFAKYDGKYILDIIRESAPLMKFELDVHWIHRGGKDPVSVLKDYAGLVDLVHLKDYRIGQLPPNAFEFLQAGDFQAFMTAFEGVVQFAEVGEGNLDFKAIIDQSLTSGAKYLLIEQDNQYGRDPFDCLATSRDNLIALGYSNLL